MAIVYWLHLKEHTDVFTQGYVGVTSVSLESRFSKHVYASTKKSKRAKSILSNAINKYGKDSIILSTICIASVEYVYELEFNLRPTARIGWNTQHGGFGRSTTPQCVRDKISKALTGKKGVVHTEETKKKMSKSRKGKSRPKDLGDKIRNTLISRGPWNTPTAQKDIWINADTMYQHYLMGWGYRKSSNNIFKDSSVIKNRTETVFAWFKRGWIPNLDENWVKFKNNQGD